MIIFSMLASSALQDLNIWYNHLVQDTKITQWSQDTLKRADKHQVGSDQIN